MFDDTDTSCACLGATRASIIAERGERAKPVNLYRRRMQKGFISFLRADGLCLAPPLVVNLWSFVRIAGRQARGEPAVYVGTRRARLSGPCFSRRVPFFFACLEWKKKERRIERERERGRERSVTIKPLNNCGRPLDSARLIRLPVGAKLQTSDGWTCYRESG